MIRRTFLAKIATIVLITTTIGCANKVPTTKQENTIQRLAFKMKLKVGAKDAYIQRHKQLWPDLKLLLKEAGISEYSIFLDEETHTLFAFQKVNSNSGSQDLADNEIKKKWWAFMADIMETNPDNSPVSSPLEEVFYLE